MGLFLRGFERGLEKDAAIGQAIMGGLRLIPRAASAVGRWATTYKGTGIPSSITSRVKPLASRAWGGIKSEAPRMGADVASQAAMGEVFKQRQKKEGVTPGPMFQPGQRTFT